MRVSSLRGIFGRGPALKLEGVGWYMYFSIKYSIYLVIQVNLRYKCGIGLPAPEVEIMFVVWQDFGLGVSEFFQNPIG